MGLWKILKKSDWACSGGSHIEDSNCQLSWHEWCQLSWQVVLALELLTWPETDRCLHETKYMPGQTTQKESKLSSVSHLDVHQKRPLWDRQKYSSNNTLRYGSQVGLLGITENELKNLKTCQSQKTETWNVSRQIIRTLTTFIRQRANLSERKGGERGKRMRKRKMRRRGCRCGSRSACKNGRGIQN